MTLNVQNLDRLISYLEALPPDNFNMKYYFSSIQDPMDSRGLMEDGGPLTRWLVQHACGTSACVAGHINLLRGAKRWRSWKQEALWLGLSVGQGANLFHPPGYQNPWLYDLNQAVRTLRHLRNKFVAEGTIVIDWKASQIDVAPPVVIAADKPLPEALTRFLPGARTSLASEA